MWTLISFTEIAAPLAPYRPGHTVGIIENDAGEREIAQVEGSRRPLIGMAGEVRCGDGALKYFVPEAPGDAKGSP